jgi:hypothetical protein
MDRKLALAAACLTLIVSVAACQPVDGGAGGSPSPEASAAESNAATDAPEPTATMGTDYSY